jgi:hypothetical protein
MSSGSLGAFVAFCVVLQGGVFPDIVFKTNETDFVGKNEGAFDEFAVLGEEIDGFGICHCGEFVFEIKFAILLAGRVEEFLEVAVEVFEHGAQLGFGGWLFGDVDRCVGDILCLEEFECLAAGAAIGVLIDFEWHRWTPGMGVD